MTFLYKFNKNGSGSESYIQASDLADANRRIEAKLHKAPLAVIPAVVAITRNARMSAAKGRPLARECQGLPIAAALKVVEFSPKKAAKILKDTILSAAANAKNNHNLDVDSLVIKQCVFDESVRIRRFWPTARGSAHPIAHRLCHCKVVLIDSKECK